MPNTLQGLLLNMLSKPGFEVAHWIFISMLSMTLLQWPNVLIFYSIDSLDNFDLLPSWKYSVYLSHVLPICIGNIKKEQWCSSQNKRKLTIHLQSERLLLLKGSQCALQFCLIHWRRNCSFHPNLCCTNKLKVVLDPFNR